MADISGRFNRPLPNLSTGLFDLIGRIRRAIGTLRIEPMSVDRMQGLTDEIVRWQIQLRREVVEALGDHDMNVGWDTIVAQIDTLRRERDTAQTLHSMAAQDLQEYDRKWSAQRAELEALREAKRG